MKPRLPIPVSHERCPLSIPRGRAALIVAIVYGAGVATALWLVVLVKGGSL